MHQNTIVNKPKSKKEKHKRTNVLLHFVVVRVILAKSMKISFYFLLCIWCSICLHFPFLFFYPYYFLSPHLFQSLLIFGFVKFCFCSFCFKFFLFSCYFLHSPTFLQFCGTRCSFYFLLSCIMNKS